jgi:hypothetical protein
LRPSENYCQIRNIHRYEHFDEITAGRINIVEPDGAKRMVISNKAQFPGT